MTTEKKSQFVQRLKFVHLSDLLAVFPMLLGLVCSLFLRHYKRNIWLVCERKDEARDNGYWFYKYICDNHKEIDAVYAINKKAPDYEKVKDLGKVISFGSLIHWIYYFAAKRNISSQKEGKPNAALCFVIEVYFGARKNVAYIRHGICKDDQRWVYYDVTKMDLFACSAQREYEFVSSKFGYPEGAVKMTGLCRFDHLLSPHQGKRQIAVMPTMREWLRSVSSDTLKYENSADIAKSEYVITWNSFLNNRDLHKVLEENNVELLFFPHASLQKYIHSFSTDCRKIVIANSRNYDVQTILMESAMLITDYSSVFFDFAYMKKPLVYYQFDYEKYRKGQYQDGYFSYKTDGFGPVVFEEETLVSYIMSSIKSGFKIEKQYADRANDFFAFFDNNNCKRTYNAVLDMKN